MFCVVFSPSPCCSTKPRSRELLCSVSIGSLAEFCLVLQATHGCVLGNQKSPVLCADSR